ncbi:MAG: FAD/FMN-containing dehydrogenase [Phycisphaerales bacterium]|jgi:FAD/FMN-containing dehydrogenase
MSEHHTSHAHTVHESHSVVVVSESNGAGFWGFILSLLGVTCCVGTCFSWVGLVVSLVGLTKKPRGFAIAGVVLGAVGTTGGIALWGTVARPATRWAGQMGLVEIRTAASIWNAEKLVIDRFESTGTLPTSLAEVTDGSLVYVDQWGTDLGYRASTSGEGYSLHSAGPDTAWGTGDEISYTVLDADEPGEFIVSRGTVSLIDASTLPYTPEQIENAPVPDEQVDDEG